MRLRIASLLVVAFLFLAPLPVKGEGIHIAEATALKTFRLHVAGAIAPNTTFWVAYGPLAGRFGIIRLYPHGRGTYAASKRLPAHGRTTFAFVAGHGTIHARFGPAPGNPVVTIRVFESVSVGGLALPTVQWQAPVG